MELIHQGTSRGAGLTQDVHRDTINSSIWFPFQAHLYILSHRF